MGMPIYSVATKQTTTLTLDPTATGRQIIPLVQAGPRGQVVSLKIRQATGGVVTTASCWVADSAAGDWSIADPPDEYVALKALTVTMTPSDTVAAVNVQPGSTPGSGFFYSAGSTMALVINITAVSAATPSTLIIDVIVQSQR